MPEFITEIECSECETTFEIEEQSQGELEERLKHLNDEDNEMERLCPCCEQGQHFPSHSDIESELQYPNWADHTGFYISVECSKCGEECNVEFEMRTDSDIEVVD